MVFLGVARGVILMENPNCHVSFQKRTQHLLRPRSSLLNNRRDAIMMTWGDVLHGEVRHRPSVRYEDST